MSTLTAPATGTDTMLRPLSDLRVDNGDHERFSHYADKDAIMAAYVDGTPVVALCGKTWVPSRDPKRYPVCPDCKDLYDRVPDGPTGN